MTNRLSKSTSRIGWVAVLLALAAGIGMVIATPFGVGFSRDSTQYARYAEVIMRPKIIQGWTDRPDMLAHFPPLYPLLLTPLQVLGVGVLTSARWVAVFSAAVECLLVAGVVQAGTRGRAGVARTVLSTLFYAGCPGVLGVHLWAFSEAPFLVFLLASLWLTFNYLHEPTRRAAALAGCAVAGMCLTRYTGFFVFAGLLPVVFFVPVGWRERFRLAFTMCVTALGPIALIMLWQKIGSESIGNRHVEYHALTLKHGSDLLASFAQLFASQQLFPRIGLAAGLALMGVMIAALLICKPFTTSPAARAAVSVTIVYTALLLFSVAFIDTATPLDFRLFCPVSAVLVVWAACDIPSPRETTSAVKRLAFISLIGVTASAAVSDFAQARFDIRESVREGKGLAHRTWRESELIGYVRALPPEALIFTNYPDAIYVHTGRAGTILPTRPTAIGREDAIPLADRLAETAHRLTEERGFIAYFNRRASRNAAQRAVTDAELETAMPLVKLKTAADGWLYRSALEPTPATLPYGLFGPPIPTQP